MILSSEQRIAYDQIMRFIASPVSSQQYFILAGYAGTGKTTLLQHIINQQDHQIVCLAPTGKAAAVLGKKLTNARVSTVHRALYKPSTPSTAQLEMLQAELINDPENRELVMAIELERKRLSDIKLHFNVKENKDIFYGQLVVVDEASMVPRRMHMDLLDTGAKVLYVGDPGQLPPVNDDGTVIHKHTPDAMLSTIHRQALDSPIIRISMLIRQGEPISDSPSELCAFRKIPKGNFQAVDWLQYDQIVTGMNISRRRINRFFRKQKGFSGCFPVKGDKLICLKNETEEGGYINGVQGSALSDAIINPDFGDLICHSILYDGEVRANVPLYQYPFLATYDDSAKELTRHERIGYREFDFSYAITAHKAQGSEWDSVLLADDGMRVSDREFRKRWLYTAVTRAKEKLLWLY